MPNLVAQVKRAITDSDTALIADLYDDKFCTRLETSSLLHFDDPDDPLKDDCGNIWQVSKTNANVSPIITSDVAKFSGACYFDGTYGLYSHDLFQFSGQDLTFDFWVYPVNATSYENGSVIYFVIKNPINDFLVGFNSYRINTFNCLAYLNGRYYNKDLFAISHYQWHHFAITHKSNQWRFFLDGVLIFTTTLVGSQNIYRVLFGLNGGYFNDEIVPSTATKFRGYIDEFRFVDGKALWTSNFTPPTQPYKLVDGHIPCRLQGSTQRLWAPFNFIKTDLTTADSDTT